MTAAQPPGPGEIISRQWPARRANWALGLLGAISLLLYSQGAYDQAHKRIVTFTGGALLLAVPYFLASWVVLHARPARSTWLLSLGFAVLFSLVGLNTKPYLSTDLYRYIWDGRVQAAGINPYRYPPADIHLGFLRDDRIYPNINRRDYARTIYPPVAQGLFLAATRVSESVTCIRLAMLACEGLTLWALVRLLATFQLPAQRTLLFAWHPLVVWEFAGGGHIDAAMIVLVVLALLMYRLGKPVGTGLALASAFLVKLFPLVLAPALYRRFRWGWQMPAAFIALVVLCYLPYTLTLDVAGVLGFLPGYAGEEGIENGDRFFLLNLLRSGGVPVDIMVFGGLVLVVIAVAAAWAIWRPEPDEFSYLRRSLCLATIFLAVLSPGYSWYYAWLVPFLCFLPYRWLFWFTASPFVTYLNWLHPRMRHVRLMNAIIYTPALLLGLHVLIQMWVAKRNLQKTQTIP